MNIIEALQRGKGKAMLVCDNTRRAIEQSSEVLRWVDGQILKCPDILRQDWLPYKEKKQIVIKGVVWHRPQTDDSFTKAYPSSAEEIVFSNDKYDLINKPKMTMTLDWEE